MSFRCLYRVHMGINGSVAARDGQIMPLPVMPLPHSFIPVSKSRAGLQMSAALSSSCEDLTLCGVTPEWVWLLFKTFVIVFLLSCVVFCCMAVALSWLWTFLSLNGMWYWCIYFCVIANLVHITKIIIIRPHGLHTVQRCILLLQMSHIAWCVCLCVLGRRVSYSKTAEPIKMLCGTDLCRWESGWTNPFAAVRADKTATRCGLCQISLDTLLLFTRLASWLSFYFCSFEWTGLCDMTLNIQQGS